MHLSLTKFVAAMAALFAAVFFLARFIAGGSAPTSAALVAPAPAQTAAGESEPAAPEPAVAFEQSADRLTLGSGRVPEVPTGPLVRVDGMLRTLVALPDGPEKQQLAGEIAALRDRDAIPVLLDWAVISPDRALLRAALDSLGPLADAATIADIERRFGAAFRADDRYRLAKIIRNITNPEATPALIALAEKPDAPPQLSVAATEALATIGSPVAVSTLLGRLAVADPDDTSRLRTAISRIDQPAAVSALRFAALGNKDTPSDEVRAAAVQALANFSDDETRQVLVQLSADAAPGVRTAATEILSRPR